MDDSLEPRERLARLLRENSDVISERLERKFVEEYPDAKANGMSAVSIHRLTLAEIGLIARAIGENDVDIAVHKANFGHIIPGLDYELSQMASSLATTLFMARHIAPVVYFLADIRDAEGGGQELLFIYERFVRDVLVAYCDEYVNTISRPGAIMRTWDLLSGLELDIEPEVTPAKKHQRVVVAESELASGGMRSLWEGDWLTSREKDVLKLLVAGKTNGEIAAELGVKQNTVKNHVARIFSKFGVRSRAELLTTVLGS